MTAESTVNDLIADQNTRAGELSNTLIQAAAAAQLAAITAASLPNVANIPIPNVTIPGINPFNVDQTGEFKLEFNGKLPSFKNDFATAWSTIIDTYFPDIAGCIRDNSDDWICNMIVNGGNGIPPAVEQQIWDRARSREVELARVNSDNAINEWAARGFALPPGALVNRVQAAQQDAIDKAATISRDVAIKNIEIQIENIRFAVEQAIKLRLGAIQAAVDYVKAYFLPTQLAIDYAKSLADAHYRYYNAMDGYYAAVIGAARLQLDARKANQDKDTTIASVFGKLVEGLTNARVMAAVQTTQGLGAAAAAALGSMNSVANIGHNTAA